MTTLLMMPLMKLKIKLKDEEVEEDDEEEVIDNEKQASSGYKFKQYRRFDDVAKKVSESVNSAINTVGETFKGIGEGINRQKKDKMSKLVRALPYMEEEDIHEIVTKIIEGDESLKDVNISAILPFLADEDCDALFLKAIKDGNSKIDPAAVAPFVSKACMSQLVDKYVAGEMPDLDVDALYPFLSSKDIRRVFDYLLSTK